jgi:hypothetical protein
VDDEPTTHEREIDSTEDGGVTGVRTTADGMPGPIPARPVRRASSLFRLVTSTAGAVRRTIITVEGQLRGQPKATPGEQAQFPALERAKNAGRQDGRAG